MKRWVVNSTHPLKQIVMTKKELLEAIEDMPEDAMVVIVSPDSGDAYVAEAINVSLKYNQIEIC